MFSENDRVITLVEKDAFPKGTIGVVVSKYSVADVYEVELWDDKNYPVDVVTFKAEELQKVEVL
ncbi:MAG: DUF4926 domain-containing protein [Clostridiales bacterium]|nr:DUF4926 domain-containing protein [Clostridiales bacterium]